MRPNAGRRPGTISGGRKGLYYLGTGLMVLGFISFASTFVTFALNFGDFSNFDAHAKSDMLRAFGGMFLIVVGGIVRGAGARGLAGSGVILDPEQAREDLEPYTRMAGGMVKDALEEDHLGEPFAPVVDPEELHPLRKGRRIVWPHHGL